MNRDKIKEKVTGIFRDVFDDASIEITDKTTAADIEDWDSLTHISLISKIEGLFDIRFSMKEVIGMKDVGEMLDIIDKRKGA